ncbi:MAG: tRNA (adenine-N1)-methyltransferase [Candidatus Eisenbacteria bacterium]|nr:tRNA (adenine-N1)-methyltransferase [Candidatus Eisenbacteria bacterium]
MSDRLIVTNGYRFRRVVTPATEGTIGLPTGSVTAEEIRRIGPGGSFAAGPERYYVLTQDLYDHLMYGLRRETQIVYPKEAGYLLLRLDLGPGRRVGEAGAGSGALTAVLSRAVGTTGEVHAYEIDARRIDLARRNLDLPGWFENVRFHHQPLEDGIAERELDAFFLDLERPWEALTAVQAALRPSGHVGIVVPTMNQVTRTLEALDAGAFLPIEIVEILIRNYKLAAQRMRPRDRMVGHTGYLIFARSLTTAPDRCAEEADLVDS